MYSIEETLTLSPLCEGLTPDEKENLVARILQLMEPPENNGGATLE